MRRDARFWRNVALIAVAHIALAAALVGWSRDTRKMEPPKIVWLNAGVAEGAVKMSPAQTKSAIEKKPESNPTSSRQETEDTPPAPVRTKSEIEMPVVTPSATPTPTPTPALAPKATVTPTAKASPKPKLKPKPTATPKSTPTKKGVAAKATPAPSPKEKTTVPEQPKNNEDEKEAAAASTSANENGSEGKKSGGDRASEFSQYAKMLHDRFYSEWVQPTTSVAAGAKMSVAVRIRIEKDGRVSKFTIVRPSGNVVVDESIAAVEKRVPRVDPLPKGLGTGPAYEVNINFEFNPAE